MSTMNQTELSAMMIRERLLLSENNNQPQREWLNVPEKPRGQSMLKNLGVASALVLCAVTLRSGAIPQLSEATDAVLTAATDQSLLDEPLGKLSFVSSLFPETVLVFGEKNEQELYLPVSGGVVIHAWSEAEPYMMMRSSSGYVFSASEGEVLGVYHGHGDERLVQVTVGNEMTCLYGNLGQVSVSPGDYISAGAMLGTLLPGEDLAFEVRKNGFSIDPAAYFLQ